jgi:acetylglutamate kinase
MSLVVVKLGGAVAEDAAEMVLALALEHDVCVVHGAGPQITAEMERFGIEVCFVGGRRVTSEAGLAVVRSSFAAVNRAVCAAIGPRALPMFGDEVGLHAAHVGPLGFVGDPLPSRPPAIVEAVRDGRIPVVAPLAVGPLNVNADEAAAALAVGLEADRIVFVTDVPGLLVGDAVAPEIAVGDAVRLLDDGELEGGIVPKLRAAVSAARNGVDAVIGDTAVVA